jgi:S1-C subfamily serine protease
VPCRSTHASAKSAVRRQRAVTTSASIRPAVAAAAATVAATAAAIFVSTTGSVGPVQAFADQPVTPVLNSSEQSVVQLFQRAAASVVNVTTFADGRQSFSRDTEQIPVGSGSGMIWDKAGHIVTNYHVVKNASAARITLSNMKTYPAELRGFDADKDIAVLTIDAPAEELVPIDVGSSSDLFVGQSTYAIGNPFGLGKLLLLQSSE